LTRKLALNKSLHNNTVQSFLMFDRCLPFIGPLGRANRF
jgi:hypothetical protein